MSGVDALEQTTIAAPVNTGGTGGEAVNVDTVDSELDAIWDRSNVTNGADRGDGGRFTSTNGDTTNTAPDAGTETTSLEGETAGEGGIDGSTPAGGVPLPANWAGKEAIWEAIPVEHHAALAAHQQEIHSRMSEMGRHVSAYRPLAEAAGEFAEYFNGNMKWADGSSMLPADGVRYLANIQRSMDSKPLETLLSIADTYNLRAELAKTFGGQVQAVPADQQILVDKIAGLERTIAGLRSPANIDEHLEKREMRSELSRFAASKPLYAQVESDLPFFITKAKTQLGEDAGRTAILDRAYDLAVQADPTLRAQSQAAKTAADGNAAKAEAAKRANGVNVTSTSSGKAKQPTLDDELGAVWDNSQRKN